MAIPKNPRARRGTLAAWSGIMAVALHPGNTLFDMILFAVVLCAYMVMLLFAPFPCCPGRRDRKTACDHGDETNESSRPRAKLRAVNDPVFRKLLLFLPPLAVVSVYLSGHRYLRLFNLGILAVWIVLLYWPCRPEGAAPVSTHAG